MNLKERARRAAGKRGFAVALFVEYYPTGGNDSTRAQIYEAVNDAITMAVSPFGTVASIKIGSLTK